MKNKTNGDRELNGKENKQTNKRKQKKKKSREKVVRKVSKINNLREHTS